MHGKITYLETETPESIDRKFCMSCFIVLWT